MEQIQLPNDGRSWLKKLLGIDVEPTEGEIKNNMAPGSNVDKLLAAQEAKDARRLIEIGPRTGNTEALNVGRTKLRVALGKDDSTLGVD
mgnify:CR=1 FL=1